MADEYWRKQSPEHVFAALMGSFRELASVADRLAEGLGYPRSEGGDDDPNGGGYITGEHTPASLALQACAELKRLRSSRQAWAEEAMRQSSELNDYADLLETCAKSPSPEHLAKVLRRMAARRPGECEFVANSGNACEEEAGHDGPHRRWFDEIRYEDLAPSTVCACPPEGASFPAPWTPPQCAVHPDGQWARPIPECSTQNHAHGPHEVLFPDLSTRPCPGLGPVPSSVLPDGEAP